ncbi:hypothetical protein CHARACLAT_004318 [Characodon lateralis]|uniref:Uncharacterized protein n=1 Tax=Characodon lateralis TaxID=208331 RepID=A0ABU7EHP2_9TELE|nr:hypothetical protein [Characodon lateralis]
MSAVASLPADSAPAENEIIDLSSVPSEYHDPRVAGELVPISSSIQARGGVLPEQVASQSQGNTHAQEEHPNSMKKDHWLGVELRTFLLQTHSATNCTTMQPKLLIIIINS